MSFVRILNTHDNHDQEIFSICIRTIFEYMIPSVVGALFLFWIVIRYCELRYISKRNRNENTISLNIKFALGLFNVFINVGEVLLICFPNQNYWARGHKAIILVGCICDIWITLLIILQLILINIEFSKNLPFKRNGHQIFWGILSVCSLIVFFYSFGFSLIFDLIYADSTNNPSNSIKYQAAWLNAIYGFFRCLTICPQYLMYYKYPQDTPSDELIYNEHSVAGKSFNSDLSFFDYSSYSNPLLNQTFSANHDILSAFIEVQVSDKLILTPGNKKNSKNTSNKSCFELKIKQRERSYKLLKTVEDFQDLHQILRIKEPKLESLNFHNDIIHESDKVNYEINKQIQYIKDYIHLLLTTPSLKCVEVLNFFEVQLRFHTMILNSVEESNLTPLKKLTRSMTDIRFNSVLLREEDIVEEEQEYGEASGYSYVSIEFKKYQYDQKQKTYYFEIELFFLDNPNEKWTILKRYNDFVDLHASLCRELNIKLPSLPKKMVFMNDTKLQQRMQDLQKFLTYVANEKCYYQTTRTLAQFLMLPNQSLADILNTNPTSDLKDLIFQADVVDFYHVVPKDKKPYVIFEIKIVVLNVVNKNTHTFFKNRRYKQFKELHKMLKLRMHDLTSLPELPSGTSLGFKVSNESRKNCLQIYLNKLFQLPVIWESFAFRKFLGIDIKKVSRYLLDGRSGIAGEDRSKKSHILKALEEITEEDDSCSVKINKIPLNSESSRESVDEELNGRLNQLRLNLIMSPNKSPTQDT